MGAYWRLVFSVQFGDRCIDLQNHTLRVGEGRGSRLGHIDAFTKSGGRLVCLVLAYGKAKDGKIILKCLDDDSDVILDPRISEVANPQENFQDVADLKNATRGGAECWESL